MPHVRTALATVQARGPAPVVVLAVTSFVPKTIWTGTAAGATWTLEVRDVYAGPLFDPVLDEPIPDSHTVAWRVLLSSPGRADQSGWWAPSERQLGLELRGWSKVAVGKLKRHLISLGERP